MKLFSLVDPRLCGSRSHRSPHELALRISDRSNLILFLLFNDDLLDLGYAALAPTGRHTSSRFVLSSILILQTLVPLLRGRRFARFFMGFDSRSTSLPPLRISPPRMPLFQDSVIINYYVYVIIYYFLFKLFVKFVE